MSLYLVAVDRDLQEKDRIGPRLLFWLEKLAIHLPDMVIIDTIAYRDWYVKNHQPGP